MEKQGMTKKYRKAIFIVTYERTKKDIGYLILKRKLHWRGWEFPKGAIKFFETKRLAVERELFEETGLIPLKIKKFDYSGRYDYNKMFPNRSRIQGQSFSLYAAETKKVKVRLNGVEHSNYKWAGFEKALKMLKWPNQKKSLEIVDKWLKEKSQKA